ncbi:MAG: hypothetical protein IH847_08130 [Acidobacteria bacterium]|nr:hypothetical protein [Acidobacteriota bacterium]
MIEGTSFAHQYGNFTSQKGKEYQTHFTNKAVIALKRLDDFAKIGLDANKSKDLISTIAKLTKNNNELSESVLYIDTAAQNINNNKTQNLCKLLSRAKSHREEAKNTCSMTLTHPPWPRDGKNAMT